GSAPGRKKTNPTVTNTMSERRELNHIHCLDLLATSTPYPARRLFFSVFIDHYSIYSDLHTSIEILDIECHSLKRSVVACSS
uniref:Uncharacterized protein n=1 Tax=Aegilops tauschii subsp. strangulata TaxID=200361 RepID=A0A453QV27_AEGTS